MSERITQELRDAMSRYSTFGGDSVVSMEEEGFDNLCDSIDSIHANLERENDRLKCELDRVLGELDDMHKTDGISDNSSGFMQNAEHHAWAPESHYVMLPKDSTGEPIHLGDVMEWCNGSFTVHELKLTEAGWQTWDSEHGYTVDADECIRHHHADSWERIVKDAHDAGAHGKVFDLSEAVARCKALAGDAK